MKKILLVLGVLALVSLPFYAQSQSVGGGSGTINQLDQFRSTTTPQSAITQQTFGKPLYLTGLNPGECLATAANGLATTTGAACSGASGTVGAGTTGQVPYYAANGTTLTATSTVFIATTGQVGIGTASPNAALDVSSASFTVGIFRRSGAGGASAQFRNSNNGAWDVGVSGAASADFSINRSSSLFGTEFTILSGGNVGIGTTSPLNKLTVSGGSGRIYNDNSTTGDTPFLTLEQDGSGDASMVFLLSGIRAWQMGIDNSDSDKFKIGYAQSSTFGSNSLTLDTLGNASIGTTAPLGKLHVSTASSGATPQTFADELIVENSGNVGISLLSPNTNSSNILFGDSDNSNVASLTYDHATDLMGFRTNNGTRMVIDSSGNVGIATTTPGAKFAVNNTGTGLTALWTDSADPDATPSVVDANGRWGIGTSSPTTNLAISVPSTGGFLVNTDDATGRAEAFMQELGATMAIMQWRGSSNATFPGTFRVGTNVVGGDTILTAGFGSNLINLDGATLNVGIGTTSPQSKLQVTSSASPGGFSSADDLIVESNGSTDINIVSGASNTANLHFSNGTRSVGLVSYSHSTNAMTFNTSSAERMRIDTNGNVGIGVTPVTKLDVYNATATSTTYVYSGGAGLGGRIIVEDVDGAGCTEITTLNGALLPAIVACP